jgi:hypothetical protein
MAIKKYLNFVGIFGSNPFARTRPTVQRAIVGCVTSKDIGHWSGHVQMDDLRQWMPDREQSGQCK